MIAFVRGEIENISDNNAVIDVGGIGINVRISSGTAARLPGTGKTVKLYTYTCVREDAFWLYGFLSRDELEFFKLLITVNGIGPKGGLAILSAMSADDLRFAIISGDTKAIAKAPGIGAKTAGRVILDLRDKITLDDTLIRKEMEVLEVQEGSKAKNEAVEALIALGYSSLDAQKAVKKAAPSEDMDVETILKLALKNMF